MSIKSIESALAKMHKANQEVYDLMFDASRDDLIAAKALIATGIEDAKDVIPALRMASKAKMPRKRGRPSREELALRERAEVRAKAQRKAAKARKALKKVPPKAAVTVASSPKGKPIVNFESHGASTKAGEQ